MGFAPQPQPAPAPPPMTPFQQFAQTFGVLNMGRGYGAMPPQPAMQHVIPNPSPMQMPSLPAHGPFAFKDWTLTEKTVCKELTPFDTVSAHFKLWYRRIRDHAQLMNPSWLRVLDFIEAEQRPISWSVIWDPKTRIDTLLQPDLQALAQALYSFLGMNMSEAVHHLRESLAGGEAGNGFERWGRLYYQHKGGSTLVRIHDIRAVHAWPQCKDIRHLNTHVGEWLTAQAKYAATMPPEHLREYFVAILPDDLKQEVQRRRGDLPSLTHVINFVQDETVRQNDQRLSDVHQLARQNMLGSKSDSLAGVVAEAPPAIPNT